MEVVGAAGKPKRVPDTARSSVTHLSWSKMCQSIANADSKTSGGSSRWRSRCGSMNASVSRERWKMSDQSGRDVAHAPDASSASIIVW